MRPFFVMRLFFERDSAVRNDMEVFFPLFTVDFRTSGFFSPPFSAEGSNGSLSPTILPSSSRTILVEYFPASSGLWVTMITRRSFAISFISSMIWILVSLSSAPVGSSASSISGSLTSALAIATRCICPPDIWFGRLWS